MKICIFGLNCNTFLKILSCNETNRLCLDNNLNLNLRKYSNINISFSISVRETEYLSRLDKDNLAICITFGALEYNVNEFQI